MRLLRLYLKNIIVKIFLFIAFVLFIAITLIFIKEYRSEIHDWNIFLFLLGILITIILIIFEKILEITSSYLRFKMIEGQYLPYSYLDDKNPASPDYTKLRDAANGIVTLKYVGKNNFEIILKNTGTVFEWHGTIDFTETNTATLGWWYVTPPSMRDSVGYKKLIVLEDIKPLRIYLFSEDRQGYGREVLIKIS